MYRRLVCSNTNCFISATNLTTEYLKSLASDSNIFLSTQTIDVDDWRAGLNALPTKQELRNKLSLPQDKTIILGVGNFIEKKNWELVINSMLDIEKCLFILIGSGEKCDDYVALVSKYNLSDKVKILDRKEGKELKKYFKVSDIFVLPSLYEQFGFVVSEALASGLPVICSKNTGASTLIVDGYNGYVVDPYFPLDEPIKRAMSNLDELSANSKESINKLTLENRAKEFFEIFEKIN
nr:glycosyltransferase [Aliiglaciecola lipolytica]